MTPLEIRLSDHDRAELQQAAEWLPLHDGLFVDQRASTLLDWEQQCGVKLLSLLDGSCDKQTVGFPLVVAWLARQAAGLTVPAFDDFNPHPLGLQIRALKLKADPAEAGDVDPPPSSSADTSAETTAPKRSRAGSRR